MLTPSEVMHAIIREFNEIIHQARRQVRRDREIELDDRFYEAVEKELRGRLTREELTAAIAAYQNVPGYSAEVLALEDLLDKEKA
jgi:hypothetical protein